MLSVFSLQFKACDAAAGKNVIASLSVHMTIKHTWLVMYLNVCYCTVYSTGRHNNVFNLHISNIHKVPNLVNIRKKSISTDSDH